MKKFFIEKQKRIPVHGAFDVAVVGAGVAGISAAIAASRRGSSVCLIEKETAPGGLATLGLVAVYLPLCDGRGTQVISGIAEELLRLSVKYGPGRIPGCWRKNGSRAERLKTRYRLIFNPASFALALDELLEKNGVKTFYDTRFCDCFAENNRIKALIVENKSGRTAIAAGAVVDASGDADLCCRAGEKTVSVDNNKKASWYYLYKNGDIHLRVLGKHPEKKARWNEKTFSGTDAEDVSKFCMESRRMALADIKKLASDYSKAYPSSIPSLPQLRKTRRLRGLYELDIGEEAKYFSDAVCMTGDWRRAGPVYCIPYRTILGKKANLFAAGRCISVTWPMWEVTRAIPTCAATGQAAGTAASLCAEKNTAACDIEPACLQSELLKNGVIIKRGI